MASISKKHRRGPWSQTEDNYLLELVHTHGAHNWVRISELIAHRSPKQCRERYHQNLKPSLNLTPITPEEGALIERMVNEMGKRWAEIARRLHGRSDNAVKNWWNGGMNRRKRLEGRRAEAARRLPTARPTMDQNPQAFGLNPSFAEYAQRPAYPMDQFGSMARMPVAPPHPVFTGQAQVPSQRHMMDPQIPSPSAVSQGSHDSEDGAPPSLVSDSSRGYSTNQSPQTTHPAVELPPLAAMPGEKYPFTIPPAQEYAYHPGQTWSQTPQDMYQQSRDYYGYGYNNQQSLMTSQPGYQQLALPPFHTITGPDVRQPNLNAQPRDSRMAVSKIVD